MQHSSLLPLLLLTLFHPLQSAIIRVSDAEPPFESYWTSFDSEQFYLNSTVQATEKERIVTVSTGPVLGRLIQTYRNRSAYAFLGIPYAEAPEYSLRFRVPQEKKSWIPRIYDGRQVKPACGADPILTYKKDEGGPVSEDCLHAYVYASKKCIYKGGCSVMAVVHGGKFNFESPAVFPEDVIVDNFASSSRDVITVLIGFRLGSFGWINLSPDGNSAPKNLGFHDILAGLKWIQKEIHQFGGDKSRVTLFGHSSGACLVDTLSLSPRSKGLFSQLVIASAASLLSASEINKNVNIAASWAIAKEVGCAPSHYDFYSGSEEKKEASTELTLRCLRSIPYKKIIDAQRFLYNRTEDFYGPAIDGDILPSSNWDLIPTRPLYPTLIGTVNAESRIGRFMLTPDGKSVNSTLIDEYCRHVGYGIWFERKEEVYRACFDQYSKDRNALYISEDLGLFMPVIKSANALSREGNKVYYYHYTYTGSPSAFDNRWGLEKEDRPAHSEEYIYILGLHRANFSAKDYQIQEIFSRVFSDFVNGGDPTPEGREWPLYEEKERNYFEIDFPTDSISSASFPGRSTKFMSRANDFWIDLIQKKIAGNHTLVEKFPEGFDVFQLENLSQLLKSHYANESTHHDKTEYAVKIGYERWTEWTEKRRNEYLFGLRDLSLDSSSNTQEMTLNEALAILQNVEKIVPKEDTHQLSIILTSFALLITICLSLYGFFSLLNQFILRKKKRSEYTAINEKELKTSYGLIY